MQPEQAHSASHHGRPSPDNPQATPQQGCGWGRRTHGGSHVPDHIPGHHGAVFQFQLHKKHVGEIVASGVTTGSISPNL